MKEIIAELEKMGFTVEETVVTRNGVTINGLIVGDGESPIRPMVNPKHWDGLTDAKEIAERIAKIVKAPVPDIDRNHITSKDFVLENVVMSLQKKSDVDIPKEDFLDLEIYFRVYIDDNMSYVVRKEILKQHHISYEELKAKALENTRNKIKHQNIFAMMGMSIFDNNMMVLSIDGGNHGAVAMCFSSVLDEVCDEMDSESIIIVPSSIHEAIAINPSVGITDDNVKDMINEVNATELAAEDILSDHPYKYTKGGRITM